MRRGRGLGIGERDHSHPVPARWNISQRGTELRAVNHRLQGVTAVLGVGEHVPLVAAGLHTVLVVVPRDRHRASRTDRGLDVLRCPRRDRGIGDRPVGAEALVVVLVDLGHRAVCVHDGENARHAARVTGVRSPVQVRVLRAARGHRRHRCLAEQDPTDVGISVVELHRRADSRVLEAEVLHLGAQTQRRAGLEVVRRRDAQVRGVARALEDTHTG